MQTERDAQIVSWIGRIGAAGAEHVSELLGIFISTAYARLRDLKAGGLVEHYPVLHRQAGIYAATRRGLRWQGLDRLPVFRPTPATFTHSWKVATVAVALQCRLPGWQVLGERELRVVEADEDELLASAQVGRSEKRTLLHRPDLALISPSGNIAAVEVELSVKSPARLQKICGGWSRAHRPLHVYYLAERLPAQRVLRAANAVRATDRITVLGVDDVAALAERELAREREPRREPPIERALAREPQSQDLWQFPEDDTLQRASEEAQDVLGA